VGCAEDLILANKAGALFSPSTPTALNQAIAWVVEHYAGLVQNIAALEYEARAQYQVNQYLEALL
jgi:hypothetical protein